jgi:hypothetical protein
MRTGALGAFSLHANVQKLSGSANPIGQFITNLTNAQFPILIRSQPSQVAHKSGWKTLASRKTFHTCWNVLNQPADSRKWIASRVLETPSTRLSETFLSVSGETRSAQTPSSYRPEVPEESEVARRGKLDKIRRVHYTTAALIWE